MARWLTAGEAFPRRGKGLCRVCGVRVRGRGWTTCGEACSLRVHLSTSTSSQRYAVQRRDRGVCARCGCDTERLKNTLKKLGCDCRRDVAAQLGIPHGRRNGDLWDMAHIRAVSEGGGIVPGMTAEEIMGNLTTLCIWCHREDTRRLKRRARSER